MPSIRSPWTYDVYRHTAAGTALACHGAQHILSTRSPVECEGAVSNSWRASIHPLTATCTDDNHVYCICIGGHASPRHSLHRALSLTSNSRHRQGVHRDPVSQMQPIAQKKRRLNSIFDRGRDGDNNRHIVLRLVDAKNLHAAFHTKWRNWVDRAPVAWKQDGFLQNNSPVGVTIRYGQNQPLRVNGAFDVEGTNWENDRDYKHIRQFTFSLATHIRCVVNFLASS